MLARLKGPVLLCLLTALTFAVYRPVLDHAFISYDDPVFVTENTVVRNGISLEGIRWSLTSIADGNWIPLTWFTHMLDVSLYGVSAGGHHLTSLLVHIANVLLLFVVLRHMTGRWWRSCLVAALFAVHPLHVEPVAWIAERKELLSTFFGLLALGAYVRYVAERTLGRYLAVAVLFSMSLMSKPMWVTFPVLLLLLDFWPLDRMDFSEASDRRRVLLLAAEKVPLLALSLACGLIALVTQRHTGLVRSLETLSLVHRVENALVSYIGYLVKTVWPERLAVFYPHPGDTLPFWQAAAAAVLLAIVSYVAFGRRSRQPYLMVGWLWYLITLLPVIGLIQVGGQAMAGRYTYLPLTGFFIAVVWAVADLFQGRRRAAVPLAVLAVAIVLAFSIVARFQLSFWQNSLTLFSRSLQVTGPNPTALLSLGKAYDDRGRTEEAVPLYRQALRQSPEAATVLYNLGVALRKLGNSAEAEAAYRKVLSLRPNHTDAANNLASILAERGRYPAALKWYRIALTGGETATVHGNMGILFALMGQRQEAFRHFDKALLLAPENAEIRFNYGRALEGAGRIEDAITQYLRAMQDRPGFTLPYCRMAQMLENRGLSERAGTFVEWARRHDAKACPGYP